MLKTFESLKNVLADRAFSPRQIEKILLTLDLKRSADPKLLAAVIDVWNECMSTSRRLEPFDNSPKRIPVVAAPPKGSALDRLKVNMNGILADVEPRLLKFYPEKLIQRHEKIKGLGFIKNISEHWIILYNAPRGFYLQEWSELFKKLLYIDHKLLDLFYTKKELKEMQVHPLVRSSAIVEADFNHMRTRYSFASRAGFKELAQMYDVSTAKNKLGLNDLIGSDTNSFMKKFCPYCSKEEYKCFSKLVKQIGLEEDDADIFSDMAELETIKYEAWPKKLSRTALREKLRMQAESG